jgi:hypothetical protein
MKRFVFQMLILLFLLMPAGCGDLPSEPSFSGEVSRNFQNAPDSYASVDLDDAQAPSYDFGDSGRSAAPLRNIPLKDDQGRTIILHGCNYMGMEFGWFNHQPEDFERIASWGFNVVRLPIAWSYLEPVQGVYDTDYLANYVEPAVGYAADAGLRVILDMHQWQWSPCSAGNGAPAWTCDTPNGQGWDWLRQGHLFWDHPDYLDHFVGAWETVATFFAGDDRIFGYDLWNEPQAGLLSLPWTFDNQLLRPLYVEFIEAIRAHHPEPYILIEPGIVHAASLPFLVDPLPYERQIYAPHMYPGNMGSGGEFWFGRPLIRRHLTRFIEEGNAHGIPVMVGETGIVSTTATHPSYLEKATELFEETMMHFAWWTYWKDDNSYALLDAAGNEKDIYLHYLSRPYPQTTGGRLDEFSFDPTTKWFRMIFTTEPGLDPDVEIFVPVDRHYPNGFAVTCSDPTGTWTWSFDPSTSILTVQTDPAQAYHVIYIMGESSLL